MTTEETRQQVETLRQGRNTTNSVRCVICTPDGAFAGKCIVSIVAISNRDTIVVSLPAKTQHIKRNAENVKGKVGWLRITHYVLFLKGGPHDL
jgi:hypothetical protein